MAASVNNIAATFATVLTSTSSSSSSNNYSLNQTAVAHPISTKSISISWNPHTALPWSHKSSLLSLYGSPGPPPSLQSSISATHRHHLTIKHHHPPPTSLLPRHKLPNVTFSFLDRNHKIQTTTLSNLSKAKRLVLVGVSAAFSPVCTRFVKSVESAKSKLADLIACVAVNDVFVMKAWGEDLAAGEKVMMLSDGGGELSKALGVPLDSSGGDGLVGLGGRSRRFCLSALNGVVTSLSVDFSDDEDVISPEMNGDLRNLC